MIKMETFVITLLGIIGARIGYIHYRNSQARKAEENFRGCLVKMFNGMKDFTPAGSTQLRADSAIAIDTSRKKICVIRAESGAPLVSKVWSRDQILSVDLVENKQSVRRTSTDRGSQLMGASIGNLFWGRTGAVIGGLSGQRVTKAEDAVYQIDLAIVVKDFADPVQVVSFLGPEESCQKNTPRYREVSFMASQWHARLTQLIKAG